MNITPSEQYDGLASAIGLKEVYFKREDLHPYGSHKGRSIPVMIEHYVSLGDTKFAISSSGNAAIAAAMHISALNEKNGGIIELEIFVGQNASPHKVEKLKAFEGEKIKVYKKERPLQALTQAVQDGYKSLRQSTDDTALIGYASLARELAEIKNLRSVFIGTSSGTTAQALAQNFAEQKNPCEVHIVQTSSCHPLTDEFESYDGPNEVSIADAIVDITALRKTALVSALKKTGGRGFTVTNDDIRMAMDLTEKHTGLSISTNSALSVAGLTKAVELGLSWDGPVACIICGE